MTVAGDKAAAALARLEESRPEAFIFGKDHDGDNISGITVRLEMGETKHGKCPVVTIDRGDGTRRSVWATHTALRAALARVKPRIGDGIAIRCLGERTGKNGQIYVDYQVAIDRDQPFSWDDSDGHRAEANPWTGELPFTDEPPY